MQLEVSFLAPFCCSFGQPGSVNAEVNMFSAGALNESDKLYFLREDDTIFKNVMKQHRQRTYNGILRHVRAAIVAVGR